MDTSPAQRAEWRELATAARHDPYAQVIEADELLALLDDLDKLTRERDAHRRLAVRARMDLAAARANATEQPTPTVLDFGTTTDTHLALAQGLLRNPDNGELR